jgi:hypothetical protein
MPDGTALQGKHVWIKLTQYSGSVADIMRTPFCIGGCGSGTATTGPLARPRTPLAVQQSSGRILLCVGIAGAHRLVTVDFQGRTVASVSGNGPATYAIDCAVPAGTCLVCLITEEETVVRRVVIAGYSP